MKSITKKGQAIQGITAFVMGIATVTIVLAVVFIVLAQVRIINIPSGVEANHSLFFNATHYCPSYYNGSCYTAAGGSVESAALIPQEYLGTGAVITKMQTIPTWLGIIIVVSMAVVVLSYFYFRKKGSY